MRKAAVICEFNPFHNGHKFLLDKIKSDTRPIADEIVCIMSGSFVQRGDLAITDKFARTEAALQHGADLAVELPTAYAMANAQVFAERGVMIADQLGCDRLCFGAENSIEELYAASEMMDRETTQAMIAALMKEGCAYPRALSEAIGAPYDAVIAQPNNILALEYIRACRKYGIEPIALPRTGAGHDSDVPCGDIASATMIRGMITSGKDSSPYTPMRIGRPAGIGAIEPAILYRLKTITAPELARIADVSEGLENRIIEIASKFNSFSEILEHLKTKRYTMARLRRILLSALLGITGEMQAAPVPYLRVLGVRRDKKRLIRSGDLPLIVDVKRGYDALDNSAKEIFDIDLKATELMNIASGVTINEFSHGIIM